jgi:hypothetical protein
VLLVIGIAAIAVAAAVVARDPDPPRPVAIDERHGVLGGIRFGASQAQVQARLGEPTDDYEGFFPRDVAYTGPIGIPSPQTDQRPPTVPTPLHYDGTSYLVSPTVGVFSMATTEAGARTSRGVGIGDDLTLVRERYPSVLCDEFGPREGHSYPWCRALVGDVRIFFGDDPIASITLTAYR